MDVRLLYFDGCPDWHPAESRLREALEVIGSSADVSLVSVSTPDEAERLGFRGSPTVLLDGVDPFADVTAPVGLSCRVFRTPEGLRGSPTVDQLVQVLRDAS